MSKLFNRAKVKLESAKFSWASVIYLATPAV
jgi:hypothetical protein